MRIVGVRSSTDNTRLSRSRLIRSRLIRSRLIRPLDDLPVWSIVCVVIRGGHRKRGYTTRLMNGAVENAASRNAPAVESYPVDPGAGRIDLTTVFVGIRRCSRMPG